jgi:(2Fe-2S) ferredoxin
MKPGGTNTGIVDTVYCIRRPDVTTKTRINLPSQLAQLTIHNFQRGKKESNPMAVTTLFWKSTLLQHLFTMVLKTAAVASLLLGWTNGFIVNVGPTSRGSLSVSSSVDQETSIDPVVSEKFKILTCSATSCCKKRSMMGLDEFSTFSSMYTRIQDGEFPNVQVEETTCLGSCQLAPCVAVEHEDFVGTVALDGMTDAEFGTRVFHSIISEEDADRVWSSVDNAIRVMAEEEDEEEMEEEVKETGAV